VSAESDLLQSANPHADTSTAAIGQSMLFLII
jgi:hypothetical protein